MQWQAAYAGKESYWNAAKAYYAAHGNLDVPAGYKSAGGLDLHAWVDKQWQMYHRPTENNADKRQQLEKIGMTWECAGRWHLDQHEKAWHDTYLAVRQYWQANGSLPTERDKTKRVCVRQLGQVQQSPTEQWNFIGRKSSTVGGNRNFRTGKAPCLDENLL